MQITQTSFMIAFLAIGAIAIPTPGKSDEAWNQIINPTKPTTKRADEEAWTQNVGKRADDEAWTQNVGKRADEEAWTQNVGKRADEEAWTQNVGKKADDEAWAFKST
ncbi:hypothetical protein QR685DRAFT_523357 [Neurospora intermedia]|uniref:Uncharacterized protein n=1 Tax=Neurospora intermedia TaxID=5142 RepID=A0ABR3DDF8_NEUIN